MFDFASISNKGNWTSPLSSLGNIVPETEIGSPGSSFNQYLK